MEIKKEIYYETGVYEIGSTRVLCLEFPCDCDYL